MSTVFKRDNAKLSNTRNNRNPIAETTRCSDRKANGQSGRESNRNRKHRGSKSSPEFLGDAKVRELDDAVGGDEEVAALEVAVDHVIVVQVDQTSQRLPANVKRGKTSEQVRNQARGKCSRQVAALEVQLQTEPYAEQNSRAKTATERSNSSENTTTKLE